MDRVWNGSNFKSPKVSTKVRRALKRDERDGKEEKHKRAVRAREKHQCRFPLCGCRRFRFINHVAHLKHKGIGGDQTGDRSQVQWMILVCPPRHREHLFSIDKKTIMPVPVTTQGTDGPVAWMIRGVDLAVFVGYGYLIDGIPTGDRVDGEWLTLAKESKPGILEPLKPWQREVLEILAEMRL
jgi:hypothetical protein